MSLFDTLRSFLEEGHPVALATVVEVSQPGAAEPGDASTVVGAKVMVEPSGKVRGSLGVAALNRVVARDALGALGTGLSALRHYGPRGEVRQDEVSVFIDAFVPPPRMVIFGAVDFSAALVRVAKVLGYRVSVCDARPAFATRARFRSADEVVVDWPDRYLEKVATDLGPGDAVCVLTHDPKFDVPAIVGALSTEVGYIGVMGSRRTHATRLERLREAGVTEEDLRRVMAPIGIDIGARTPEETALSIVAEIVALRNGRPVPSFRDSGGPLHVPLTSG